MTDARKVYVEYLLAKVGEADWHAVSDVANDLREMDAAAKAPSRPEVQACPFPEKHQQLRRAQERVREITKVRPEGVAELWNALIGLSNVLWGWDHGRDDVVDVRRGRREDHCGLPMGALGLGVWCHRSRWHWGGCEPDWMDPAMKKCERDPVCLLGMNHNPPCAYIRLVPSPMTHVERARAHLKVGLAGKILTPETMGEITKAISELDQALAPEERSPGK